MFLAKLVDQLPRLNVKLPGSDLSFAAGSGPCPDRFLRTLPNSYPPRHVHYKIERLAGLALLVIPKRSKTE